MTYRDDHDAAIARARALELELERVRGERDALEAKVARLDGAGAAAAPHAGNRAEQDAELATDLAQAVQSGYRSRSFNLLGTSAVLVIALLCLAVAGGASTGEMVAIYSFAGVVVILVAVLGLLMRSPSHATGMIEALRTNPERITRILQLHKPPGLIIYAGGDPVRVYTYDTSLLARLTRRCPNAKLH